MLQSLLYIIKLTSFAPQNLHYILGYADDAAAFVQHTLTVLQCLLNISWWCYSSSVRIVEIRDIANIFHPWNILSYDIWTMTIPQNVSTSQRTLFFTTLSSWYHYSLIYIITQPVLHHRFDSSTLQSLLYTTQQTHLYNRACSTP